MGQFRTLRKLIKNKNIQGTIEFLKIEKHRESKSLKFMFFFWAFYLKVFEIISITQFNRAFNIAQAVCGRSVDFSILSAINHHEEELYDLLKSRNSTWMKNYVKAVQGTKWNPYCQLRLYYDSLIPKPERFRNLFLHHFGRLPGKDTKEKINYKPRILDDLKSILELMLYEQNTDNNFCNIYFPYTDWHQILFDLYKMKLIDRKTLLRFCVESIALFNSSKDKCRIYIFLLDRLKPTLEEKVEYKDSFMKLAGCNDVPGVVTIFLRSLSLYY